MKKKIIGLLLVIAMLVTMMPTAAFAVSKGDTITFAVGMNDVAKEKKFTFSGSTSSGRLLNSPPTTNTYETNTKVVYTYKNNGNSDYATLSFTYKPGEDTGYNIVGCKIGDKEYDYSTDKNEDTEVFGSSGANKGYIQFSNTDAVTIKFKIYLPALQALQNEAGNDTGV